MKKVGLFFLALVLMAGMIGGYHYSQQMTPEEKKAELLSLLSDGKYDKDFNLVDLAGFDPSSLTERVRAVSMEVYQNNRYLGSQTTLGYIYSQEYVIVPKQLFYVPFLTGRTNILDWPAYQIKIVLLPDPTKEDSWKKEELGTIEFVSEGDYSGFAIVERIDPIVGSSDASQYTFGKYEDLSVGDVLYRVSQENGRLIVESTKVAGLHSENNINLISSEGLVFFQDFGGLFFAVRDGKLELVGMLCAIEPIQGESGWVYTHGLDINQIIAEIEKIEKK